MTTPSDPRLLTQVKQYRFVRELGHGGMGVVFEAIDVRDGGRVAVKLLHPWLAAEDSSFRDRFEREAHIAALLRSPYTVRLLDFGVAEGTYFLVMEYVEGTTVGHELKQGTPMEPVRALRIAIDVARALEEAAARGVTHRDIKPDNILLTPDGRVKVTDFGIARQEGGAGLTSAGRFVGTADYAAPEQAVGEADHRSDIYALGATLYCMLTGHPPFSGASVWDVLREHQRAPVPMEPLSHLPDSINNPIRRCMEKDPRDRYQTASELAGALERALAAILHAPPSPRRTAGGTPSTPPSASRPPSTPPAASRPPSAAGNELATVVESPGAATPPPTPPPAPPPAVAPTTVSPAATGDGAALAPTRIGGPAPGPEGAPTTASPAGPQGVVKSVGMVASYRETVGDVSHYELTLTNADPSPVRLALTAKEPTGVLSISVPSPVMLTGGQVQRLPVEVRQLRPAPGGVRVIQFQVSAQRDDGARIGFVNVSAIPAAAARRSGGNGGGGGSKKMLIGGAIAAVVVAAGAGGAYLLAGGGGDEDGDGDRTATSTSTRTSTATTTRTATATPGGKSIEVIDRWDYAFRITSNDCGVGAAVGALYPASFRIKPVDPDATAIFDGEKVEVVVVKDRDYPIGEFTFHFVDFEFTYQVIAEDGRTGTATVRTTYSDPLTIADTSLTERYEGPACTITGKP